MLKKTVYIIFVIVFFSSCQSNIDNNKKCQILRLNIRDNPHSLEPGTSYDIPSNFISQMCFEGLMRKNHDGRIEYALAEHVKVFEDKKTYIFTLKDAHWSNGDKIVSKDFSYSWRKHISPDGFAFESNLIIRGAKDVKEGRKPLDFLGLETPDDKTLIVHLEYSDPYFLDKMSESFFFPLNHRLEEKEISTCCVNNFVCNGPFIVKDWKQNYSIILEKSPTFREKEKIKLQKIDLCMVTEQVEMQMFENNELDWAGGPLSSIPPEVIHDLKKRNVLQIIPLTGISMIQINTEKVPLNNKNFRKALNLAINRKKLVEHILEGVGIPAYGVLPPKLFLQDSAYFFDGDEKLARNILKKALEELNIQLYEIDLEFTYRSIFATEKIALFLQAELKRVLNLDIKLKKMESKAFIETKYLKNYQLANFDLIYHCEDPYEHLKFYTKYQVSIPSFEKYSKLIENAKYEIDIKKRKEYLHEAEKLFMEELPMLPLFFHGFCYIKNPELKNVIFYPYSFPSFIEAYFQ